MTARQWTCTDDNDERTMVITAKVPDHVAETWIVEHEPDSTWVYRGITADMDGDITAYTYLIYDRHGDRNGTLTITPHTGESA